MEVCFQTTPEIMLCKGADGLCAFAINMTDDEVTVSVYERGVSGRRLAYGVWPGFCSWKGYEIFDLLRVIRSVAAP
jgi:hypothetical protein